MPTLFRTLLENGRKLSLLHFDHFSEMGGNCPCFILTIHRELEEIILTSTDPNILIFSVKWEEIVSFFVQPVSFFT